jgi:tryptophanase
MADRDPVTRQNRYPDLEMVRLAIPRRVYTNNHMDYTAAVVRNVFERRDDIRRGVKIGWEAPILRHFTLKLERL